MAERWSLRDALETIFREELPPGTWRDAGGDFDFRARLAREYQVYGGHIRYDLLQNHQQVSARRQVRSDVWTSDSQVLQRQFGKFLRASDTPEEEILLFRGDDTGSTTYALPAWAMRKVIGRVCKLPQAFEIVTSDWEWIFVSRMIGYVDYGSRPGRPPKRGLTDPTLCHRCHGTLGKFRINATGRKVYLCPECDALWPEGVTRSVEAYQDFATYMESLGLPGRLSEVAEISQ